MANHSSAKKAHKQAVYRTAVNKNMTSRIKTFIKKALSFISSGSEEEAKAAFINAQAHIAKGVTKGLLKKNNASRKISKLAQKLKAKTTSK